jgi:prepilin-type processing-associated H-X9-DG protein
MKLRHKLLSAILPAAAALTVCAGAPSPMERVTRQLQSGGELYFLLAPATLDEHISESYSALERGIAESSLPGRESAQSLLAVLRAANRLIGIPEIAAFGASSIKDAALGFSNRAVIAAGPDRTGWMWRTHGKAEPRLARIGALPGDTAWAVDFGVDLRPWLLDLKKTGGDKWLSRNFDQFPMTNAGELLESLSGDWRIAIAIPEGCELDRNAFPIKEIEKFDVYISVPDKRDVLKKLLGLYCTVKPSFKRVGNVTYISDGGGDPKVLVTLEHRMLFFSSPRSFDKFVDGSANVGANGKFVPGAKPSDARKHRAALADDPAVAAAIRNLPADSHGAYFFNSARIGKVVKIGGNRGLQLSMPRTVRAVGTLRIDDGMIEYRELATKSLTVQTFEVLVEAPLQLIADKMLRRLDRPAPAAKKAPIKKIYVKKKTPTPNRKPQKSVDDRNAECRKRLEKIRDFVADYKKNHHGALPPSLPDASGCGAARYVYFAPFSAPPSGKMPLVADPAKGTPHPGKVNVLFVDGSIGTFDVDAGGMKRLCSFLHTIYRYDEKEFVRLIERASQLDAEGR